MGLGNSGMCPIALKSHKTGSTTRNIRPGPCRAKQRWHEIPTSQTFTQKVTYGYARFSFSLPSLRLFFINSTLPIPPFSFSLLILWVWRILVLCRRIVSQITYRGVFSFHWEETLRRGKLSKNSKMCTNVPGQISSFLPHVPASDPYAG